MRQSSSHNQSPISVAAQWASIATTISLEMALPATFGYWLDNRWGTKPWLVIIGAILGLITGLAHLLKLVKTQAEKEKKRKQDEMRGDR